jgi:hypothetical protein
VVCAAELSEDTFKFAPIVLVQAFDSGGQEGDGGLNIPACEFAEE